MPNFLSLGRIFCISCNKSGPRQTLCTPLEHSSGEFTLSGTGRVRYFYFSTASGRNGRLILSFLALPSLWRGIEVDTAEAHGCPVTLSSLGGFMPYQIPNRWTALSLITLGLRSAYQTQPYLLAAPTNCVQLLGVLSIEPPLLKVEISIQSCSSDALEFATR
jgi:hypothetical protein